jgi:hypothetical protein
LPAIEEDTDRVTKDDEGGSGVAAPAGWQDWRHWVDGVDWSDWRAWLQRADWAAAIRSAERMERLKQLLADRADASGVVGACLRPPLYATRFHKGFGTLYSAEYRPTEGAVRYHWPGQTWAQSLDTFDPDSIQTRLGTP